MIDRIRRRLDWTAYTVVMLCLIFITAGAAVHGLASDAHARRAQTAQVLETVKASPAYAVALMQAVTPAPAPPIAPANVTVTPAPNPTVTAAVSGLLDILLKLVGTVATAVVAVMIKRWLGGKVSADTQEAYSKVALDAVGHAEEIGHQYLKTNAAKLDSNAKLDSAASYVVNAANDLNLVPMANDAIKRLITAKLGGTRPPDATAGTPVTLPAAK
jgi:hypothetical protein